MDIVDYINEVDRSHREQEAAYHVTLYKRDFRIRCVFYARPSFTPQLASFIPHHGGLQRKYTLLWVITETERFLYAKSPHVGY